MKCHNGQTKSLLIDAGTGLLPAAVLNRKKSPYPKTYDPAYGKNACGTSLRNGS